MKKNTQMDSLLLNSIEQAGMAVCIKDENKTVLKQY